MNTRLLCVSTVSPLSHLRPLRLTRPPSDLDSALGSGLPQTLQQEFSLVNLQIRNVNVEVRHRLMWRNRQEVTSLTRVSRDADGRGELQLRGLSTLWEPSGPPGGEVSGSVSQQRCAHFPVCLSHDYPVRHEDKDPEGVNV